MSSSEGVPTEYLNLMRAALRQSSSPSSERPLKRRKKGESKRKELTASEKDASSSSDIILMEDASKQVESPIEDISATVHPEEKLNQISEAPVIVDVEDEDEENFNDSEFDDDEFEDVDLENYKPKASATLTSDVTVSYNKEEQTKRLRKKKNVIDRQERVFRKTFHINYVASMAIHGFIRNTWCNHKYIHALLQKLITPRIFKELHPFDTNKIPQQRTRCFLDGLRHLLESWLKYFKVNTNKGLYSHRWYDWYDYKRSPTTFLRFYKCMKKGKGNRDIAAQGFVALLRAAGVPSRLVFSLQPPDFTSMAIIEKKKVGVTTTQTVSPSKSAIDRVLALRKNKISRSVDMATQAEVEMRYPVFWAEAWDSSSKQWVTVDPVIFKTIEIVKYKSKLEPPSNYPYNHLTYVLGYDRKDGVRDITKRYAEHYFARTRKKRITRSGEGEFWYDKLLLSLSKRGRNKSDEYEDAFFATKAELEGMPDNIQDFKNHPFYVLESHLKSNEILDHKDPCGMIRTKGKNSSIPVYKRSDLKILRSPRAWFQLGRVLKAGERALKTKQKHESQIRDEDDDREERLYSIDQTELYVPPPVKDGEITKNAYGNIDIYTPSMIPEGGVHIKSALAIDAAKLIGIDYAEAVVGFKFQARAATPKMEGIVVAEEYEEAVNLVIEQLRNNQIEKERCDLEVKALKGWALLITKLRIRHRLNKTHGNFEGSGESDINDSNDEFEKIEREYQDHLENTEFDDSGDLHSEGMEDDFDTPGGFILEKRGEHKDFDGSLIVDDLTENIDNNNGGGGGGFLIDDDLSSKGSQISERYNNQEEEMYDGPLGELYDSEVEKNANNDYSSQDSTRDEKNDEDLLDEYEAFFGQLNEEESQEKNEDDADAADDDDETDYPKAPIEDSNEKEEATAALVRDVADQPLVADPSTKIVLSTEDTNDVLKEHEEDIAVQQHLKLSQKTSSDSDSEMEKQIKKQLTEEKEETELEENQAQLNMDDEDYDFEYDSE